MKFVLCILSASEKIDSNSQFPGSYRIDFQFQPSRAASGIGLGRSSTILYSGTKANMNVD